MNQTLKDIFQNCSSDSKSTEKLAIIMAGLESFQPAKLDKVSSLIIDWRTECSGAGYDVVGPIVKLEFFP